MDERHQISVSRVLNILGVSTSGFYDYLKRKPSKRLLRKKEIKTQIQIKYDESKQIYGAPKITEKLKDTGVTIAVKTVSNYMREMDIRAIYRSKWVKTTVDSDFSSRLENLVKREFDTDKPNSLWVTDITYIWTYTGFVYLTSVMDLFSRKIIAWDLSDSLSVDSVVRCIKRAKERRNLDKPLIIHSDRGIQYVSKEYLSLMDSNMRPSYSKKADPWDNACIESFHAIIKREWLKRFKIKDLEHAQQLVFEYVETFYNTVRIHGTLGYVSPNQYEKRYEETRNNN